MGEREKGNEQERERGVYANISYLRSPAHSHICRACDFFVLELDVVKDMGLKGDSRRRLVARRVPPINHHHVVDPEFGACVPKCVCECISRDVP